MFPKLPQTPKPNPEMPEMPEMPEAMPDQNVKGYITGLIRQLRRVAENNGLDFDSLVAESGSETVIPPAPPMM